MGTEVDAVDSKTGCPVCEDKYFGKIKESYDQNLKRFNIVSKDLFTLYFDLSEELVKSSYKITNQYLEMEKFMNNSQDAVRPVSKSERNVSRQERGAIIDQIVRIQREEDSHFLFEDADFSITTIKNLKEKEMQF